MSLNPAWAAKVLADAGVIRAYRPSRLLRLGGTLLSWGTGPAAGSISLAARFPDAVGLIDDLGRADLRRDPSAQRRRGPRPDRARRGRGRRSGGDVPRPPVLRRGQLRRGTPRRRPALPEHLLRRSSALLDVLARERPRLVLYDEEFADLVDTLRPDGNGRGAGAGVDRGRHHPDPGWPSDRHVRVLRRRTGRQRPAFTRARVALDDPHLGHDGHAQGREPRCSEVSTRPCPCSCADCR